MLCLLCLCEMIVGRLTGYDLIIPKRLKWSISLRFRSGNEDLEDLHPVLAIKVLSLMIISVNLQSLRRRILRKPLISSWATIGSLVRGYEKFRRRIHQLPQHLKIEQSDSLLVKPLAILHKLSEIGLPTSCGSCGQPSMNVLLRRTVRILTLLRTSKTSTRGGLKTIPRGLRMTNQQWWRCC